MPEFQCAICDVFVDVERLVSNTEGQVVLVFGIFLTVILIRLFQEM